VPGTGLRGGNGRVRTIPGRTEPTARLKPYKAARRRGCLGKEIRMRWRNLCHQLMGISSVSQGNVVLAPIIGWILYAPKYLLGRCRLGKSHRSPPPSSLFWRRSIGWSTTVGVWRIVYPPPTASQKISFGVRGRLSRFRSYRTVRHRRTFAV